MEARRLNPYIRHRTCSTQTPSTLNEVDPESPRLHSKCTLDLFVSLWKYSSSMRFRCKMLLMYSTYIDGGSGSKDFNVVFGSCCSSVLNHCFMATVHSSISLSKSSVSQSNVWCRKWHPLIKRAKGSRHGTCSSISHSFAKSCHVVARVPMRYNQSHLIQSPR